jgi:hypothetical protein
VSFVQTRPMPPLSDDEVLPESSPLVLLHAATRMKAKAAMPRETDVFMDLHLRKWAAPLLPCVSHRPFVGESCVRNPKLRFSRSAVTIGAIVHPHARAPRYDRLRR